MYFCLMCWGVVCAAYHIRYAYAVVYTASILLLIFSVVHTLWCGTTTVLVAFASYCITHAGVYGYIVLHAALAVWYSYSSYCCLLVLCLGCFGIVLPH